MAKSRSKKNNMLTNKYVLYLVCFLAIIDIIVYLNMQDYTSFFTFIVIALIVRCLTKNMNIILLTAIIISSLTSYSLYNSSYYEGMKNKVNKKKSRFENLKNLQNKLGTKGIEGLTSETNELMSKQNNLVNQISKLEPMMDKAGQMLDRLEKGGALNKIDNMMSSFK